MKRKIYIVEKRTLTPWEFRKYIGDPPIPISCSIMGKKMLSWSEGKSAHNVFSFYPLSSKKIL